MLHLYASFGPTRPFGRQILEISKATTMTKSLIKGRLKEIGQAAAYDLASSRAPGDAETAHERIRLLAQFYRAAGCQGLIVLFDELERIANSRFNQRTAAYQEAGLVAGDRADSGQRYPAGLCHDGGVSGQLYHRGNGDAQSHGLALGQVSESGSSAPREGFRLLTSYSPSRFAQRPADRRDQIPRQKSL